MSEEEVVIPSKEDLLDVIDSEKVIEEEVVKEVVPEEVNPALEEAIAKGYNPEGVTGKRNLSPEEFLERGQFFDTIHGLKKQNKKQQDSIDAFQEHFDTVREQEYNRAYDVLKAEKVEAMSELDHARVVELDEKLAEHKGNKPAPQESVVSSAFETFVDSNSWYDDTSQDYNAEKAEKAEFLGYKFQKDNPDGYTEKQFFDYVTANMKEKEQPVRAAAVASQAKTPAPKKKGEVSVHSLSEIDDPIILKLHNDAVRRGSNTDKWLKSYFGE